MVRWVAAKVGELDFVRQRANRKFTKGKFK
jgi:hypothetical protein